LDEIFQCLDNIFTQDIRNARSVVTPLLSKFRAGPFTVYAPVNDAFTALPEGTVETLLQPENMDQLTNVLLYHVDDRKLNAAEFAPGANYYKPILASERLCITSHSGVTIADGSGDVANVVVADIQADNGVIHVIDKVK